MCTDSRSSDSGQLPHIRRRYRCAKCDRRITTAEFVMPEREANNRAVTERFVKKLVDQGIEHFKERTKELLELL